MRTNNEMKIKTFATRVFWGITCLKISVLAYVLIASEQLRTHTSLSLKSFMMKPVLKQTSDEVDVLAEKTFQGLDPKVKALQDATSRTKMSHDFVEGMIEALDSNAFGTTQHFVAPVAFVNAMTLFLIGMTKARKTSLVFLSVNVYGQWFITDEMELTELVDTLLLWMPAILHSRTTAIMMTALAVGASLNEIETPFGGFDTYGNDFLSYVLDRAYLSDSSSSSVENPISNPILIVINVAYILCILVILATDVLGNWYLKTIVTHLILKLKPIHLTEDNRFESFASACSAGKAKDVLRTLLDDRSFNLNQRDFASGNTGLHMACLSQNFNIVQALLDNRQARRINLNIENNEGKTPLMIAASTGNRNIVRHLLKQPKMKLKGHNGDGAIVDAVSENHFSVALSVAEEIINRGLCLRDCSRHLKDATLLETLKRCASLERKEGKKMSEEARKQSLQIYKTKILKSLLEVASDSAAKEELTQERIQEDLKEFLECPICCEEYGEGPILACWNDHWICSNCHPKNAICPWCRKPWGGEDIQMEAPRRCRTSEKILKLIAALELPQKRP